MLQPQQQLQLLDVALSTVNCADFVLMLSVLAGSMHFAAVVVMVAVTFVAAFVVAVFVAICAAYLCDGWVMRAMVENQWETV